MGSLNTVCLVCGSGETRRVGKAVSPPKPEISYTYFSCDTCGSRFFDPKEHDVDIKEENEKFSMGEHHVHSEFKPNPYWAREVASITALKGGPVSSVLDCGCRTGDFLMHWPAQIQRTGVEIVPQVAEIARRRGLDVINEPLEQSSLDAKYDVVTCYAILEHLHAPEKVLDALCQSVDEKGILVIMIPSFQTWKARLLGLVGRQWHQLYPPFHLCFFSNEYLSEYLQARCFHLERRVYTSGGMFNPFAKIPLLGKVWAKMMSLVDAHSPTRFLPIFDHMYLYYRKVS